MNHHMVTITSDDTMSHIPIHRHVLPILGRGEKRSITIPMNVMMKIMNGTIITIVRTSSEYKHEIKI